MAKDEEGDYFKDEKYDTYDVIEKCSNNVTSILVNVSKLYYLSLLNFTQEKRKDLLSILKQVKDLNRNTKKLKNNVHITIRKLEEDDIESGHHYVQVLDYLRETTNCLEYIVRPLYNHLDNNHPPLNKNQIEELHDFNEKMSEFFNFALTMLRQNSFEHVEELQVIRSKLIENSKDLKKSQIKLLKKIGKGTKVSLVYIEILNESKNILLFTTNVIEAQYELVEHGNGLNNTKEDKID